MQLLRKIYILAYNTTSKATCTCIQSHSSISQWRNKHLQYIPWQAALSLPYLKIWFHILILVISSSQFKFSLVPRNTSHINFLAPPNAVNTYNQLVPGYVRRGALDLSFKLCLVRIETFWHCYKGQIFLWWYFCIWIWFVLKIYLLTINCLRSSTSSWGSLERHCFAQVSWLYILSMLKASLLFNIFITRKAKF